MTQSEPVTYKTLNNGVLYKYDDGLLHFKKDEINKASTPEGTMELYNEIVKLQNKEKSPVLLNLSGLEEMDMNCRAFLINKLPEISTSVAFVIDKSPVIKLQFALANYISKKTIPVKFFHSEKEALSWINKQTKS